MNRRQFLFGSTSALATAAIPVSAATAVCQSFATGGPVEPGNYITGELGPETLIPRRLVDKVADDIVNKYKNYLDYTFLYGEGHTFTLESLTSEDQDN